MTCLAQVSKYKKYKIELVFEFHCSIVLKANKHARCPGLFFELFLLLGKVACVTPFGKKFGKKFPDKGD